MGVSATWPPKDAQEKLDFELDWDGASPGPRLEGGETIVTSEWRVDEGTVEIAASPIPTIVGGVTLVWLENGTDGETCIVTNTITTSLGRTREASAKLKIKEK